MAHNTWQWYEPGGCGLGLVFLCCLFLVSGENRFSGAGQVLASVPGVDRWWHRFQVLARCWRRFLGVGQVLGQF